MSHDPDMRVHIGTTLHERERHAAGTEIGARASMHLLCISDARRNIIVRRRVELKGIRGDITAQLETITINVLGA